MSAENFKDDPVWKELFANYLQKIQKSQQFMAHKLEPGINPPATDFEEMAKAYGEERIALKKLREYEEKMGYF